MYIFNQSFDFCNKMKLKLIYLTIFYHKDDFIQYIFYKLIAIKQKLHLSYCAFHIILDNLLRLYYLLWLKIEQMRNAKNGIKQKNRASPGFN